MSWCTLTVPSLLALMMLWASIVKIASFTKDVCPRNSFSVFPDLRPCILEQTKEKDNVRIKPEVCRITTADEHECSPKIRKLTVHAC